MADSAAFDLIINREWGLTKNKKLRQGEFIIEDLTEFLEAAVLAEFERIADRGGVLARLQQAVIDNANVFDVLMDAVRVCSLGQISNALFEVGGQYRWNM